MARNLARRCAQQFLARDAFHFLQAPFDLVGDGIDGLDAARDGRRPPAPARCRRSPSAASRSWAVIFSAVAASCALSALRHRMEAQPSGEITE